MNAVACLYRTTVWKDMVERERKGHSATVEDFAPGLTSWLQRNRQYFMILLAAAAFAVLLSEPLRIASQPYLFTLTTLSPLPSDFISKLSFTGPCPAE